MQNERTRLSTDGSRLGRELLGLLSIFLGLLVILSLATFDNRDPWLNHVVSGATRIHNKAGLFGAYLAGLLLDIVGAASWAVPAFLCLAGVRRVIGAASSWPWWRWTGFALLGLSLCLAGAAGDLGDVEIFARGILPPGAGNVSSHGGGIIGHMLYVGIVGWMSPVGAFLVWLFSLILALQMLSGLSVRLLAAVGTGTVRRLLLSAFQKRPGRDAVQGRTIDVGATPLPQPVHESTPHQLDGFHQFPQAQAPAAAADDSGREPPNAPAPEPAEFLHPEDRHSADAAREAWLRESEEALRAVVAAEEKAAELMNDTLVHPQVPRLMPSHEEAAHARPLERGAAYSAEPNSGASPAFSGDEENDLPPWVSDFEEGRVGVDRVAPTFQEERDRPLIPFLEHQPEPDPFEDEDLLGLLWGVTKDDPDSGTRTSSDTLEHSKPIVFTEENKLDPSMRTDASDAGPLLSAQTAAAVNILREAAESEPDPELHSGPAAMALPSEDAPAEHARSAQPFSPAAFAPAAVFAPENDTVEKEYDDIPIFEAPAVQAAEPERTGPARTILRRAALPSLDLLRAPQAFGNGMPRAVLEEKGGSLMTCLRDFGIQGELVGITPGPVVTMFEVRPAPGVRVSRIANLSDDLALALKAVAVRIQAPVPGTDTVGVEIPNEVRETVSLKELLGSQVFGQATSLLTLALGKDIAGHPAVADLATMPHLLVAGATGAGKSVGINSIILSLIYKARPEEVKLLLVDPKRVEMAIYADLPHLVHPVVTEMQLAKNALEWAVSEMEERYNAIAKAGVRNIADYNAKIAGFGDSPPEGMEDLVFMPYLVLIIDELADLMLVAAKEVETSIVRLAQLARAAGIHLILATQRPSVDVVTGLIKANFPCRISFQVTSKHDSRTILDSVGAEHLLGKGDMLFKPAGGKFVRMHGAFVSDQEVNAVVSYWKTQQKPDYSIDFAEWNQDGGGNGGNGGNGGGDVGDDPMYNEAVDFVRQQGKASISLIQRKFRIGFNKAARYVEQMEMDGVIGPADGSKPRLVIR